MKMKQTMALMLLMGALLVPEIAKASQTLRRGLISVGLRKPTMRERAGSAFTSVSDRAHELSGGEVGTFSATHRGRRKGRKLGREINKGLNDAGKAGIEAREAAAASLGLGATHVKNFFHRKWLSAKEAVGLNSIQDQMQLEFLRAGNDPAKLSKLQAEIKEALKSANPLESRRADIHTTSQKLSGGNDAPYKQGDLFGLMEGTHEFIVNTKSRRALEKLQRKVDKKHIESLKEESVHEGDIAIETETQEDRDQAKAKRDGEGVSTLADRQAARQTARQGQRDDLRGKYGLKPPGKAEQARIDAHGGTVGDNGGDGESAGEQAHKRSWLDRLLGRNKPPQNQDGEDGGEEKGGYGE